MLVSFLYARSFPDTQSFIYRVARKGKHATMLEKLRKAFQAALNVLKSLWCINIFFSVFHDNNNRDNESLKL